MSSSSHLNYRCEDFGTEAPLVNRFGNYWSDTNRFHMYGIPSGSGQTNVNLNVNVNDKDKGKGKERDDSYSTTTNFNGSGSSVWISNGNGNTSVYVEGKGKGKERDNSYFTTTHFNGNGNGNGNTNVHVEGKGKGKERDESYFTTTNFNGIGNSNWISNGNGNSNIHIKGKGKGKEKDNSYFTTEVEDKNVRRRNRTYYPYCNNHSQTWNHQPQKFNPRASEFTPVRPAFQAPVPRHFVSATPRRGRSPTFKPVNWGSRGTYGPTIEDFHDVDPLSTGTANQMTTVEFTPAIPGPSTTNIEPTQPVVQTNFGAAPPVLTDFELWALAQFGDKLCFGKTAAQGIEEKRMRGYRNGA